MKRISKPPILWHGEVSLRLIRLSDAKPLTDLLLRNRSWLSPWEATVPGYQAGTGTFDLKWSIKNLLKRHKDGSGYPFVVLYRGEIVGQMSVSDIAHGAVQSGNLGYWISEHRAGLGITPIAAALAIDYMLTDGGLHRIEVCIRPENGPSLKVVEKLGLPYEGRRRRFIHIDGDWRDHDCFSILAEELYTSRVKQILR